MRRMVLVGIVAAGLLAGCSSATSSGAPGTTRPPVTYELVDDQERVLTVKVSSPDDVEAVADRLHAVSPGEDSRTVSFLCPGGPATVAYARWANTNKGLAQTGLTERDVVVIEMTDQPCLPAP